MYKIEQSVIKKHDLANVKSNDYTQVLHREEISMVQQWNNVSIQYVPDFDSSSSPILWEKVVQWGRCKRGFFSPLLLRFSQAFIEKMIQ